MGTSYQEFIKVHLCKLRPVSESDFFAANLQLPKLAAKLNILYLSLADFLAHGKFIPVYIAKNKINLAPKIFGHFFKRGWRANITAMN